MLCGSDRRLTAIFGGVPARRALRIADMWARSSNGKNALSVIGKKNANGVAIAKIVWRNHSPHFILTRTVIL
jgi:hypothetical protein